MGLSCPQCREIIENLTGHPFPTRKLQEMKLTSTRGTLELDGYCKDLRLAFEYDGEQHYSRGPFQTQEDFLSQNYRDLCKNLLSQQNNIYLIRIPCWIKDKESFIKQELDKWMSSKAPYNDNL